MDFHGEKRSNETHQSTTDPEAKLARKGKGKEAKLAFSAHVLMENRHGLCADIRLVDATGTAEPEQALVMVQEQRRQGCQPKTLGGDKGYDTADLVEKLRDEIRELRALIKQHSGNSSRPPSTDPPWAPRKAKPPTGRKAGGQPGHDGTSRELVHVNAVDKLTHVYPSACRGCGHALSPALAREKSGPLRHQITELPPF